MGRGTFKKSKFHFEAAFLAVFLFYFRGAAIDLLASPNDVETIEAL